MSTTDHRVRVTKALIREAFTGLIREKPIRSISVRELSERAGINRGTFYTHYEDLYALLAEMEGEILVAIEQALVPLMDHFTEEADPYEICLHIFRCLKEHAELCGVLLGEHGDEAFVARLLRMGQETCVATYSRHYPHASLVEIEDFYAFVSTGCIGLLRRWVDAGMTRPAEEIAGITAQLMRGGIDYLAGERQR